MDINDLKPGMILKGTVRNVIDFGVFVDIGVHQDGLVHISQMSATKRVNHPLDVVSVGDVIDVRVMEIDTVKERIALSMILDENEAKAKAEFKEKAKNNQAKKPYNKNFKKKSNKNGGLNLSGLAKFMNK
jgi:uncharacterized protein